MPTTPTGTTGARAPGPADEFYHHAGILGRSGGPGGGQLGDAPCCPLSRWRNVALCPLVCPPWVSYGGPHTAQDPESQSCGMDPSIWGATRNLWVVLGSALHPDGRHGGARERGLITKRMVHRAAASGTQPVAPCRPHRHPQKHTSSITLHVVNSRRSSYFERLVLPQTLSTLKGTKSGTGSCC